jgi:hypothetical protein
VRGIEDAPLSCAIAMEAEGVRKARVKRSPYSIAYKVLTEEGASTAAEALIIVRGPQRPN